MAKGKMTPVDVLIAQLEQETVEALKIKTALRLESYSDALEMRSLKCNDTKRRDPHNTEEGRYSTQVKRIVTALDNFYSSFSTSQAS